MCKNIKSFYLVCCLTRHKLALNSRSRRCYDFKNKSTRKIWAILAQTIVNIRRIEKNGLTLTITMALGKSISHQGRMFLVAIEPKFEKTKWFWNCINLVLMSSNDLILCMTWFSLKTKMICLKPKYVPNTTLSS